jgi:glucose-6-phosphate-specific signal transduction histidine kinase
MDELSWLVQAGMGVGLGVALMWVKSLREELSQQQQRTDRIGERVEENTQWMRDILTGKLTKTDLGE